MAPKLEPPRILYYRVQWPTREPRPKVWSDRRPSVVTMLRRLLGKEKGK